MPSESVQSSATENAPDERLARTAEAPYGRRPLTGSAFLREPSSADERLRALAGHPDALLPPCDGDSNDQESVISIDDGGVFGRRPCSGSR